MTKPHIQHGFPPHLRRAAAEIYFKAFRQKIGWLLGGDEKGVNFIEAVIDPEYAICAISGEGDDARLVGLAGFKTREGSLVGGGLNDMISQFGLFSSLWRAPVLSLLERDVEDGVLLMDGIAVSEDQRGKGTGTRLLDAIADHGRTLGKQSIRLDVIDANPRAKALYQRKGFVAFGEEHLGPLRHLFGFSSATRMKLELQP